MKMSNPTRRRSSRLSQTPNVNYQENKIELKSTTSDQRRKRRDENDLNTKNSNEKTKFKKIKLKHEVTTELVVHSFEVDDEETILSEVTILSSDFESDDEFIGETDDSSDDLFVDEDEKIQTKRKKKNKFVISGFVSDDEDEIKPKKTKKIVKRNFSINTSKMKDDSVDEDGFLIPKDDTLNSNPFSSDENENENIVDVTNYCKIKISNDGEENATEKRIKKFVKKNRAIPIIQSPNKLIEHDEKPHDSQGIIEKESKIPVEKPKDTFWTTSKKRKKIETTFANFFKTEKIDKATNNQTSDDQSLLDEFPIADKKLSAKVNSSPNNRSSSAKKKSTLHETSSASNEKPHTEEDCLKILCDEEKSSVKDESSVKNELSVKDKLSSEECLIVKRKRGRPKKSETNLTVSSITTFPEKLLSTKVRSESNDEINVVEVVNKSSESNKSINAKEDVSILDNENNVKTTLLSPLDDSNIIILDKKQENSTISSTIRLDDPWTVKYKPLSSDQVLDNKEASEKIKDWIQDFTAKSTVDSRLRYYEDDEDEIDNLENCLLIHGPTGCGKTAMVYALAEELNYKVFEINCSSRRNGKFINQIKEATLSHTVSRHSGSTHNSPCKNNPKKSIKQQSIDLKQKSLLNFFQKKSSTVVQQIASSSVDESSCSQEATNNLNSLTISSSSLLLFDDVDVLFEEDTGFWQALSLLIGNTKKPIILTATNSIRDIRQELKKALCVEMNYPKMNILTNHLKEIVFRECYKSDYELVKDDHDYDRSPILDKHIKQIELISRDNHCDIRCCVNRLQFDFSSVNITNQEIISDQENSPNIDSNCEILSLNSYNNLIIFDLFSSNNHIHLNSRDELNNACSYDETYKSKDLRENIQQELRRLNSGQFDSLNKSTDSKAGLKWSDALRSCGEEIENYLIAISKKQLYLEYIPYLSVTMDLEQQRLKLFIQHTRRARRFMHYLDNIQFYLSDLAKQFLSEQYPRHRDE